MGYPATTNVGGGFNIKLKGWKMFGRVINPARFDRALKKYLKYYNGKSGQLGRRLIKRSIRLQSFWAPNSPWTVKKKGHNKTLIEWGIMLRNTGYKHITNGFEVGTHRVSDDGKYNVAKIVHDGAVVKNPGGPGVAMIPPRPFLTYALFDRKLMSESTSKIAQQSNSKFMRQLRFNWKMAIHRAFSDGFSPAKKRKPKA